MKLNSDARRLSTQMKHSVIPLPVGFMVGSGPDTKHIPRITCFSRTISLAPVPRYTYRRVSTSQLRDAGSADTSDTRQLHR